MPPIISKIIPLKGGFPKGGIKSGPRNPPRGKDYKQSPPYRGIFTHIYFLQCTKPSLFCSPPVVTSTTAASSSFSKPSTTAAPPAPQPMDLDHTNLVKKDPHSSLCFNCGKLGHIAKVCRGPHTQNVQNVDAATTLRLAPEDLQLLIESVRAAMVSSAPMMPLCESEGKKTPGEEGF